MCFMMVLAGQAVREGGFEHREPPVGCFVDEQRPDLVGEADPPRRAGGELFAGDEAFVDPAVQGRGWELQFGGGVDDGEGLITGSLV